MNDISLARAKETAKRFLVAVSEMEQVREENEMAYYGCPQSGSLRRVSMDLTRDLAKLRRPG